MTSGKCPRYPSVSKLIHHSADLVANSVHPKGSANDIVVLRYANPDGTFTLACSSWDVSFQGKADILDWNEVEVNVAVEGKSFCLSINQLTSKNDEAFHKSPKDEVSAKLEMLELQFGRNKVTFQNERETIEAFIFLYNRETARFVVTDVDGTITKSDIKGVIWHALGMDWLHLCVNLFNQLKDLGYIIIYLSGRSRGHAEATRDFLSKDVIEDGKTLPLGPVFTAPVGSMDTVMRYVMSTEAEAKIRVLKSIRSLFPSDVNPFHAGFGNRRSDRTSYRNAGISQDRIFTVKYKGVMTTEAAGKVLNTFSLNQNLTTGVLSGYFPKVQGEEVPVRMSDELGSTSCTPSRLSGGTEGNGSRNTEEETPSGYSDNTLEKFVAEGTVQSKVGGP